MKSELITKGEQDYLKIMPCGYEFPILLPVITKGNREESNSWSWNGSLDFPTLKPSIKTIHPNGTISHVWLKDGVCQHLDDSTDGFNNVFLPLQDL